MEVEHILGTEPSGVSNDPERLRREALARTAAARVEAEALANPPPPPELEAETGPDPYAQRVIVIEHIATFRTSLTKFAWEKYRAAIACLAGVNISEVFLTPEPDTKTVRQPLHALTLATIGITRTHNRMSDVHYEHCKIC